MKKLFFLIVALILIVGSVEGQNREINPKLMSGSWPSYWISCPNSSPRDYGVYHFRKSFNLPNVPAKFIIHVSADNRYRLYVNGNPICTGPARGDLYNWNFETIDISANMKVGENVIASLVWNMGVYAPVAQISNQTAFVLQGDGESESIINTNNSWKVFKNISYTPCSLDNGERLKSYMVIGPGDKVDGSSYPWGWEQPNFDDREWNSATLISNPAVSGYGTDNLWTLVPRGIPLMAEILQRVNKIRSSDGIKVDDPSFIEGGHRLIIPANRKISILFDQTFNTTTYPELNVSGGKGSTIKISYAEALFDKEGKKGNRNEIEGKVLIGNYDIFMPDGGRNRLFRPLWHRTYRYVQMEIITKDEPLIIEDFYGMYTGYPFESKASFSSNDKSLQKIWDVAWRTALLCGGETYFDCPYYEQLQYEGDTRIQALISLYVTGDDRLIRKAILDFYHSRVPEGLTQGRYPSNRLQVIPPYSLFWVSMVYDYWMYRKDDAFISQFLPAISEVLHWYEKDIDREKKMLGPMKWWNFIDYSDPFPGGVPPGASDGNSSIITLQYSYTLQQASQLFNYFGKLHEKDHFNKLSSELNTNTYLLCFDGKRNEMADTPEKKTYSQHAGIMAILAGAITESEKKDVMLKILTDNSLSPATFYYRFYLTQALKSSDMADLYYANLKPWRDMLDMGLTTFAEKPEPARSDCHAWSASPLYDFFATICGITPNAPGFTSVRIAPSLGELLQVTATIPHPLGEINVTLIRSGKNGIMADITLPEYVKGIFIWKNHNINIKGGKQKIELK